MSYTPKKTCFFLVSKLFSLQKKHLDFCPQYLDFCPLIAQISLNSVNFEGFSSALVEFRQIL